MAKSSTTLQKGDNLPGRGKSNKTRVLDAILRCSRADLPEGATRDDAEIAYFQQVSQRAFDPEDKDSAMLLKFLGDKAYASVKPTMAEVNFPFDKSATPAEQAAQVLEAASRGEVPPDVASSFVGSIANMLKIEEVTAIKDRLDQIEKLLSEQDG